MDCFAAATTGALKSIQLRDNSFTNLIPIKQLYPKNDEVTSMIWNNDDQTEVLTAQLDRQLKIFDTESNIQTTLFSANGGKGAIKGISISDNNKIFTCVESGELKVWSKEGKEELSFKVGEGITTMRGCNSRKQLITGGNQNLVKTWDMETGKQLWGAKNVPHDFLQLEVPIKCVDTQWMPGQEVIVEATKLHEMRVYDPRAQKRPIKKIVFMDVPLTAMSLCHKENHVLAANSIGEMGLFDIRSKVHPVCKYKGQAGSIRSINAHPTEPYVATCGIDRFVRVHDVNTKKLIHKIYCKTRLNKILIRNDLSILAKNIKQEDEVDWDNIKNEDEESDYSDEDATEDGSDEDSDDDDTVWDQMDNVKDKEAKKSRKRQDTEEEEVEPKKKRKTVPGRKRKESTTDDGEIVELEAEEPKKKMKKVKQPEQSEIKEEVDSDIEELPVKKRRISKPKSSK